MGNTNSRVAPARPSRIIDSQSRARSQNQRELIQFRRKINNINIKHSDEMSRLSRKRYDVKVQLHQLNYETAKNELSKKMDKLSRKNSTSSINESESSDEKDVSPLECSSLLLHNLNASNLWEKSIIMSSTGFDIPNKRKSSKTFEPIQTLYPSRFDTSYNSFEQTESFLLSDSLSLKQHTEHMKKAVKIAIARSKRNSNAIIRRDKHIY